MNYKETLSKYIENKIKLDITNSNHTWLIYSVLESIDVSEEFLQNKTVFEELFKI